MSTDPADPTQSFDDLPTQGVPQAGYLGTLIKGRYLVEKELGRGGFGVVYLVRDQQLHSRSVVIKILTQDFTADPWTLKKFRQEIEALARIDHPGVVGALDTGETADGKPFLVMQYIEGVTLRSILQPGGIDLERAANVARQVGHALSAAHDKGVWHRDLKPENIMLSRLGDGEEYVKLIDFGIAAIKDSQFSPKDTPTTRVAGSFAYMAPEQFQGKPCAQSDVWALGIIVWEMVTGASPFPADSLFELMIQQQKGVPGRPRDSRPELPEAAEQALLKALAVDPERRFQQPKQFGDAFARGFHGTAAGPGQVPSDSNLAATTPLGVPASFSQKGVPASFSQKMDAAGQRLEMAHILFVDLAGYSILPMDRQRDYLAELQQLVRNTAAFQSAEQSGELLRLPTGDGMALTFFGDPTAPVECAVQLARALTTRPHLRLRTGVHSGPVYRVADINANRNVSGGGINTAQRVMDAGDPGHILVSDVVAGVLNQLGAWSGKLQDLGEYPVKHGVMLRLYNLVTEDAGNPAMPSRIAAAAGPRVRQSRRGLFAAGAAAIVAAGAAYYYLGDSGTPPAPVYLREMEYWITTVRFDGDQPQALQPSLQVAFREDDRLRFNFTTRQTGYLYLFNHQQSLVFLYPNPAQNLYAQVGPVTGMEYPSSGWLQFDTRSGPEQIYLVWSARSIPELDRAASSSDLVNNHVMFTDAARIRELLAVPEKYLGSTETIQGNRSITLRSTQDVLAYRISLVHL